MTAHHRQDRIGLAVGLLMISFLIFSVMDTIAKVLVTAGYPSWQVAFCRYGFHALFTLAVFLPREGAAIFRTRRPGGQVIRALALLTATVLNFTALAYLPLTVTIAILFASPLITCLLSIPILGERVGIRRFAGVGFGFVGVLIITRFWAADFHPAMFLSIGAALSTSLYFVMTRRLSETEENSVSQVFSSVIPTIVLLPIGWMVWTTPQIWWHWALLAGIGLLAAIGHSVLTFAYRYAEASRVAPVVYSQIIYVTVLSWAVFGAWPTGSTMLGTAIIVASGVYVWLRERQAA